MKSNEFIILIKALCIVIICSISLVNTIQFYKTLKQDKVGIVPRILVILLIAIFLMGLAFGAFLSIAFLMDSLF